LPLQPPRREALTRGQTLDFGPMARREHPVHHALAITLRARRGGQMSKALASTGGVRSRAWRRAPLAAALGLLLLSAGPVRAPAARNLSETWKLNHELSDDTAAKVKEAAGSEYIKGGPSWATETWFPWGTKFNEGERVMLRDVLLGAVRGLERIEVDQTAYETKTGHGDEGVRDF